MNGQMERFGPTRRGGPVFRWLGEPLAIDLANTVMVVREGEPVDLLATPSDLRTWLEAERARLGECDFAVAHLDEVRAMRDAVHSLLGAAANGGEPPKDAVERVNAASAAAPVSPQLAVEASGALRSRERVAGGDTLAELLGTFARAAIDLVTSPAAAELRVCGAPSCGMYFLGARRWCCVACGNRARAARHYRRSAARPGSPRAGTSG
jgi:predicted RNA-binding Zn ribbon-like protein